MHSWWLRRSRKPKNNSSESDPRGPQGNPRSHAFKFPTKDKVQNKNQLMDPLRKSKVSGVDLSPNALSGFDSDGPSERIDLPLPRPFVSSNYSVVTENGSASVSSVSSSDSVDDQRPFDIQRSRSPGPATRGPTSPRSPHTKYPTMNLESPVWRQEDSRCPCPLPLPPGSPTSPSSVLSPRTLVPESPNSKLLKWKRGKLLGHGTFGNVYVGFNSETGQMSAIKEVRVASDDRSFKESLKQLNQEINLLSQLSHPNIVQYYGSEMDEENLYVFLEYMSGGSIHRLLQEYGPLKEPVIQIYTRQILSGLAYLHGKSVVHRDIKGANILVGTNSEIKLVDFGMAKHITSFASVLSFKGSPYWIAPEVVMNTKGYSFAVDIWSLGCTILEMATSKASSVLRCSLLSILCRLLLPFLLSPSCLRPSRMADNDAPAPPPPHDNTPPISEKEDLSLPPPEPAAPCAHPEQVTEDDSASSGMADKEELTLPPAPVTAVTVTVTESELLQEELPTQENLVAVEAEKPKLKEPELKQKQKQKLGQALQSFKEESNKVSDLTESEHKALLELSQLVEESMDEFSSSSPEKEKSSPGTSSDEVSIWGIPLLKDDRSDVILLKFLRARDFKVKDAFAMLKNTIHWRRSFLIDSLIDEDLGDDLEKVVFMHEHDKEGHPVCYNVYGEFQNKELYEKTFKDDEKRAKFLRWRVQFLEKSLRKLDFSPGGVNTIFQVSDLKNSPGPGKRELRQATKQSLHVLQDNYPEFVAKQVFINVPWWYLAFYSMITPFLTQRTKSKFVFASPARSAETLFKYISPERVPVQYGGLSVDSCDCNPEFTTSDPATDMIIKPGTKQIVEIIIYEKCVIVWELRVVGWEVSYGAEFVPSTESGYTVIINKIKKMTPTDEPVVHGSFAVSELGKLLLIVDNPTSKKKKLLYRFKVKPLCDGLAGKNAE